MIVNNAEKIEPLLTQMEQWSILSNTLTYIQYHRHPKNYHSLGFSAVNKCGKNLCTKVERDILELDFGPTTDILREEYLDVYEGIQSEILNTTRFDKNSDLSTTYLGKADRSKNSQIRMEEFFFISEQGYIKHCYIQEPVNPSCQNLTICTASCSTLYQSSHQKHRKFRYEMVNLLVYHL